MPSATTRWLQTSTVPARRGVGGSGPVVGCFSTSPIRSRDNPANCHLRTSRSCSTWCCGVIGPLADPFRAIDQALLDVVADGPPRQLGEGGDLVEGELLGGAHKLFIRQLYCHCQLSCIFRPLLPALGRNRRHPEVVPESESVRRSIRFAAPVRSCAPSSHFPPQSSSRSRAGAPAARSPCSLPRLPARWLPRSRRAATGRLPAAESESRRQAFPAASRPTRTQRRPARMCDRSTRA